MLCQDALFSLSCWFSELDFVRIRLSLVLKATTANIIHMVLWRWSIYRPALLSHKSGCFWFPNFLSLDGLTPWKFWHHYWLHSWRIEVTSIHAVGWSSIHLFHREIDHFHVKTLWSGIVSLCQEHFTHSRIRYQCLIGLFSVSGSVFCRAS